MDRKGPSPHSSLLGNDQDFEEQPDHRGRSNSERRNTLTLLSLYDYVKKKVGPPPPPLLNTSQVKKREDKIARNEEVDLKWEGGKRMDDLFSINFVIMYHCV